MKKLVELVEVKKVMKSNYWELAYIAVVK